ncbi:MAG: hypothetical protein EOP56_09380 [Sphingobacteriales bacterium]|nr:MAG: hypothetical protein EOP56_09380 [Sphingobacteriales bacterium]
MAGQIRVAIEDMRARGEAVATDFKYVAIWNNQIETYLKGESDVFDSPQLFIEMLPQAGGVLGVGVNQFDIIWRLHIAHYELDAGDGRMEQNVTVFDLRNKAVKAYAGYRPSNCTGLQYVTENTDSKHGNVYHYTIDFKCAFIDTSASPLDPDSTDWIVKEPPTGIVINVDKVISIDNG